VVAAAAVAVVVAVAKLVVVAVLVAVRVHLRGRYSLNFYRTLHHRFLGTCIRNVA
jgi:hypothetical protein